MENVTCEIRALAKYLTVDEADITPQTRKHFGLNTYTCDSEYRNIRGVYAIAEECDRRRVASEAVIDFINREILLHSAYREFFDYDACTSAAFEDNEVGAYIAFYDAVEGKITLHDNTYYIYRVKLA